MLKQMRERRRSLKSVRKNLTKLLWEVQALEWALLWLESPTQGKGEKWRIESCRTIERALKNYTDTLSKRLKEYNITSTQVRPLQISDEKIPRKTLPTPAILDASEVEEKTSRVKYKFGGSDPRFDQLTALELKSLGKYGTREADPDL
jgi:hypothetical protein